MKFQCPACGTLYDDIYRANRCISAYEHRVRYSELKLFTWVRLYHRIGGDTVDVFIKSIDKRDIKSTTRRANCNNEIYIINDQYSSTFYNIQTTFTYEEYFKECVIEKCADEMVKTFENYQKFKRAPKYNWINVCSKKDSANRFAIFVDSKYWNDSVAHIICNDTEFSSDDWLII